MMLNPQRPRRRVVPRRFGPTASPGISPASIIPYDYAAKFELKGVPGNIVQDVINISVEGVFVAVGIGYGFEEERGRPIDTHAAQRRYFSPRQTTLGQIPPEALITGLPPSPHLASTVFPEQNGPLSFRQKLFQRVEPSENISFLFSIVDSATGRELQDEPTHNLASLGKSDGERPFRVLAQPITFQPRSTIRLQVIEQSEIHQPKGVPGPTLFIVLYGYKILAAGCPEPLFRRLHGSPACPTETIGSPTARVVPFDYVARLELTGLPKHVVETEVPINVEGGFVATAVGYGLSVENLSVKIKDNAIRLNLIKAKDKIDLSEIPLQVFSERDLSGGIRIRPNFLRIAFQDNGELSEDLPVSLLDNLFESLNRPEHVSFRYTIVDSGIGRELQNRPINNIAGFGIANGERPFKRFARPMIFLPRSSIRITVEEHLGHGSLFLVFQGYKVLGMLAAMGG